jgi:hypothetical protein
MALAKCAKIMNQKHPAINRVFLTKRLASLTWHEAIDSFRTSRRWSPDNAFRRVSGFLWESSSVFYDPPEKGSMNLRPPLNSTGC